MITLENLQHLLRTWTAKKHDHTVIDDSLTLDNVPLWWFYERLLEINFLPFENNIEQLLEKINNQTLDPAFKKLQRKTKRILFQKYLLHHQNKSERNANKQAQEGNKDIVFLSYLNQVREISSQNALDSTKTNPTKTNLNLTKTNLSYFRLDSMIQECKKSSPYSCGVIVIDNLNAKDKKLLGKVNTLSPYITSEIKTQATKNAQQHHELWRKIPTSTKQQLLTLQNQSLYPYLENYLEFFFSYEMLYLTHLYYLAFKAYLQQHSTKAVVTTAISSLYEKCLLAAASSVHIPSFMIQHGIATGFTANDTSHLYGMHFCVMGPKYQKDLIAKGIAAQQIAVTGPLIFDEIVPYLTETIPHPEPKQHQPTQHHSTQHHNNTSKINSTSTSKNILFMTSPIVEDNFLSKEDYFKKVKVILAQLLHVESTISLKLHPREQHADQYQRIIQELGLKNATVHTESTRERHFVLIRNCCVFLNYGSTTALEAMMLQKPIVTIDLFEDGKNPLNTFVRTSPATLKVHYNDHIDEIVQQALDNPRILEKERKQFVHDHCFLIDGKAPQRILETIQHVIAPSTEPKKTRTRNVSIIKER